MDEDGRRHGHRDPSRSGRRIGDTDRTKSPSRSRHSPDAKSHARSRDTRPDAHHQHNRPRDRSRDRPRHHPSEPSRPSAQSDDLIPRFREKPARTEQETPSSHNRTRARSRSRDRRRSRSPTSAKRQRSRSRSPHRKRSRRDHSPSRTGRDGGSHSSKRRHRSPEGKSGSSRRHGHSHRSPERTERTERTESTSRRSRRDSVTKSPPHSSRGSRRGSKDSRQPHPERGHRSRSRSPASDSRHSFRGQSSVPSDTADSSRAHPDDMSSRHGRGGSHLSTSHYKDRNGYSKSPHRNSPSPSRRNEPNSHHAQESRQVPPPGPSHAARSPPFDPPSGPSNKGSRAGFRGGSFGRGSRGSSSWGGQWNSSRSYDQRRNSNGENDGMSAMDIDSKGADDRSFDRPRDDRRDERPRDDRPRDDRPRDDRPRDDRPREERPRDDRPHDRDDRPRQEAPKGPSGQTDSPSKFSFAFKPSKSAPSGPKPEISQKFNAPAKKDTPQKDGRNEPPAGAPTQPAALFDRKPPDGPKMAPRMRKVVKKMQRPKPRPTLSSDLVASESVFFRKPGNESVVGSGTYGKVFKGLNVYTKGQVALKRIRMEGERDGFPVTAVREIKLLQSLRHRNIVNLQEVMVEKNDCFMVFEYLSHDLTGLLNHPNFKLEPPQKKHLAQQLFEGLDYLHVRGVLHRDIKAANILVSSDGILKIADFGLARFYEKRHQLDYTNRVITIWYRSPELLLGETKYTAAVDIWSAACVMMEIFAKKPIFAGDGTELSQLDKIYNVLGTPNRHDWPGLVDMAWFELLRPTAKRKSMFAEVYRQELTPAAFDLMQSMFLYDPAKRPTAGEVLAHAYFTSEEPLPRQAKELADIGGDWHEFESKALRKENERREREARRASKNPAPAHGSNGHAHGHRHDHGHGQDRKRGTDDQGRPGAKRVHVEERTAA